MPCWKDINPRLAASYDLFGDGKTAVKMNIGRFVAADIYTMARANNPVTRAVLNASRTWTDTNGNFSPDCNLANPGAQNLSASGGDVCGALNNRNFGLNNPNAAIYDPSVLTGFGARSYNWQKSVQIQHQLRRNVAVTAGYFRALAEQADPALRGPGHGQWLERLDAEAGNLAASLRWYLGHDRGPLPHMFRVLWPFWFIRDHITQARAWIDELLPMAGSLGPQARAELLWTAAATALEVGDDTAALAARQDLAPLLDRIQDPFLHAVSQLVTAWTSPITGDFDGASRAASAALEELRSQGEPVWTALAAGSLGWLEMSAGRSDDALRHLREVRDLADRFDSDWLAAWSRAQLGTLAVMQGRLDRARELLGDALARSLEAHSTVSVTLCMIAFARLAFAEGDPDRAALWPGRPKACDDGLACGRGRCCGRARPSSSARSARQRAQTGSAK